MHVHTCNFQKLKIFYHLQGFPTVFAYTSHKTEDMYDAIMDKVIGLVPELPKNVEGFSSDFERAQIKSAKKKLPRARISGCLLHFKQVCFILNYKQYKFNR